MNPLYFFDLIRLAPVLTILLTAAVKDARHGEVSNWLWIYTPIGCALVFAEYFVFTPQLLVPAAAVATVGMVVAFGLFQAGWGGADSKALICLSWSYPLLPSFAGGVWGTPFFALAFGGVIACLFMAVRGKRQLRYLPAFFAGLLLTVALFTWNTLR